MLCTKRILILLLGLAKTISTNILYFSSEVEIILGESAIFVMLETISALIFDGLPLGNSSVDLF